MASLYHNLGCATLKIRLLPTANISLALSGPFWLLQHWLNVTFEQNLGYPILEVVMRLSEQGLVKGVRLALTVVHGNPNMYILMKYANMFLETTHFSLAIALLWIKVFVHLGLKTLFPKFLQKLLHNRMLYGDHFLL